MSTAIPKLPGPRGRVIAIALGIAATVALAAGNAGAAPADVFQAAATGSTKTIDHALWDGLLKTYVKPSADGVNRVAYAKLKAEGRGQLGDYLARMQAIDPTTLDRPEQLAYWANLYNAKTLEIVTAKYPVASIKDINLGGGLLTIVTGGPWKAKVLTVKGQALSLDDIEHGILRPVFKDPRIHYSVNCASIGCPNLMTEAFTGSRLEAQLDAGATAFVNHARGIAVTSGKVKASNIYSWFQADFGGSADGVLAHVRKYATPELKAKLEGVTTIADFDYDWRLNDAAQ